MRFVGVGMKNLVPKNCEMGGSRNNGSGCMLNAAFARHWSKFAVHYNVLVLNLLLKYPPVQIARIKPYKITI